MATLYITEFTGLGSIGTTAPQVPPTPPAAEQHVTIGSSSTQSAAFGGTTHMVMVNTDAACSLAFGANPTAVATAHRMAANETRFYAVYPGELLAVITNS